MRLVSLPVSALRVFQASQAGVEHGVAVGEGAVRGKALAQVQPDPLDRVQLGAVGRQRQERDGVGHGEPWRAVPAGLVEDEHGVGARLELLSEGDQEQVHGHERRGRQGEGKSLIGAGATGGEQVEALEALVGETGWAGAALVPAVASPTLLPDPGFILAPELDLSVRMRRGDRVELRPKPIF